MSPITHDPQATENTINELTQLKKEVEKRQTYLKENFTPQHLKTDHLIDTWWCGTAYQANEDALTTIHKKHNTSTKNSTPPAKNSTTS